MLLYPDPRPHVGHHGVVVRERETSEQPGREAEVTVIMADLRGFTRLVERRTPPQAVALLDEGLTLLARPLLAAGGVVDKYVGDGVLAFFVGEDHAEGALGAARAVLERVAADNAAHPGRAAWRVGVAVHSGRAMLGTVGPPERREFTLIGDVVNVVARLEEVAKQFELFLVASAETVRRAPRGAAGLSGPERQPIRGRSGALEVWYVANEDVLPWET